MLPRLFGIWFPVCAAIGGAIAMGIFRMPHDVAANLPHVLWFLGVWVAAGLYCLCAACPVSELAAAFPRSGGFYPYVRIAFGEFPGFLMGYMDWGMASAASALIATVAGDHLVRLFGLAPEATAPLAVAMVVVLTALHLRGPKQTEAVQVGATMLKVAAFLFIVGGLLLFAKRPAGAAAAVMPAGAAGWGAAVFLSLQAVIATFGGWALPIYFAGEVQDPGARLPKAIFRSVLSIAAIYLAMVATLVYCVPIGDVAAQKLPFAFAARETFGQIGDTFLTGLVFLILVSALSACLVGAPRILYALASDGLFFGFAGKTSSRGSPVNGLLLNSGVVVVYLLSRSFGEMLAVLALYDIIGYTLLMAGVFVLRRTRPDAARPYRAWGHPFTTGLALAVSVSFVVAAFALDTRNALIAAGLAAVGLPVYALVRALRRPS